MAADTTAGTSAGLEEIVVTAQRRTENIQNVPITIQAVTGDQLKQLNINNFSELLKYTSNVTYSSNGGGGTGNIFMRGLAAGGAPNQSQSTIAPFPNVALYLDDQSMQFPGRNNDVYMVDMERVEILEGPQGTLFGGGSQAGALRYITNKPKLTGVEGDAHAGYGLTAGGDPSSNLNATFNVPLTDKLAIRGTIFNDRHGGYIDNVPGTIALKASATRPGSPEGTNAGISGDNLNTLDYNGARLSALYQFNDDWNALIQQNWQNFESHGYYATEPVGPNGQALQHYQTMAFVPAFNKDKYSSTALTINGSFAGLQAVYAGSYLSRHIDGQEDYSNYLASPGGALYVCTGAGADYAYYKSAKATTCHVPIGGWRDQVLNTHLSHELRLSTPEDYRLRGVFGAFYEDFVVKDNQNFNYLPIPQCTPANLAISLAGGPDCLAAVGPVAGYYAIDPSLRVNTNTAFGEDVRRGYQQTAFFASVSFDLIPKVLTLTGGTRHYKYDEFEQGSEYYSETSTPILNQPNGSVNHGFGINLKKTESGYKSRANLTWHVTPDLMVYYTWSQGFRPGGFNRTSTGLDGSIHLSAQGRFIAGNSSTKQFYKPAGFESDNLTNNEIGLKSEWLDHRLQINASAYTMDWKEIQLPLFDPTILGNTTFVVNGPSYRVRGFELQAIARVTEGLTLQGSASWNSSEQNNTPCLKSSVVSAGNPTPIGQCITQINSKPYTNPYGVKGTRSPYSPPLSFNVRARYDWDAGAYKAFFSVGGNHVGSMRTQPASFPNGDNPLQPINTTLLRYELPAYETYDASIGVAKDNWTAQLTGNNLGNSDAAVSINSGQYIKQVVPIRPRLLTFEVGFKF